MAAKGRRLPETVAMFYATQLLLAVDACHTAGVIHGNVHPAAVLLRHGNPAPGDAPWGDWSPSLSYDPLLPL